MLPTVPGGNRGVWGPEGRGSRGPGIPPPPEFPHPRAAGRSEGRPNPQRANFCLGAVRVGRQRGNNGQCSPRSRAGRGAAGIGASPVGSRGPGIPPPPEFPHPRAARRSEGRPNRQRQFVLGKRPAVGQRPGFASLPAAQGRGKSGGGGSRTPRPTFFPGSRRAPARPGLWGASGVVPGLPPRQTGVSACSLFGSLANGVEPGRARSARPGACGLRPPVPAGGPAPPPPPIPRPHRPRRTVLAWVLALGCPDLGHRKRVALPGSTPPTPKRQHPGQHGASGGSRGPAPAPAAASWASSIRKRKVSPLRRSGEPEAACVRRDGGGLRPGARAAGAAARAAGERRAAAGDHRPAPDAEQPGEPPRAPFRCAEANLGRRSPPPGPGGRALGVSVPRATRHGLPSRSRRPPAATSLGGTSRACS